MSRLTDAQKVEWFDTVVEHRNNAWDESEALKSKVAALEGHLAKYEAAVRTTIEAQGWEYLTNVADHRHDWYYAPVETDKIDDFFRDLNQELNK